MLIKRNGDFFELRERLDKLVDVVFICPARTYETDYGTEYDAQAEYIIPAVTRYPDLEEDIRRNFYAWQAHAEALSREIAAIHNRVDTAIDAILSKTRE